MYCRQCGNQQSAGRFCAACGEPLAEVTPDRSAATKQTASMEPSPLEQLVTVASAAPPPAATQPTVQRTEQASSPGASNATNVEVTVAGPQIRYEEDEGPSLLVRLLWFVLIGWWAGLLWITTAAALNSTIIGLPLGLMMFNAVPRVMTLKSRRRQLSLVANPDGTYTLRHQRLPQRPFVTRAVYFVFIGCWFSILWALAAYIVGLPIVTLPISFWMFDRIPALTTLARY